MGNTLDALRSRSFDLDRGTIETLAADLAGDLVLTNEFRLVDLTVGDIENTQPPRPEGRTGRGLGPSLFIAQ